MPGYKAHITAAIFLCAPCLYFMYVFLQPSWILLFELALCMLAGALFPDVDIKSKGQKYFYHTIVVALVVMMLYEYHIQATWFSLICMVPMLTRHRGLLHNTRFLIVMPFIIWCGISIYNSEVAQLLKYHFVFFAIGSLLHVWLDIGALRFIKLFLRGM